MTIEGGGVATVWITTGGGFGFCTIGGGDTTGGGVIGVSGGGGGGGSSGGGGGGSSCIRISRLDSTCDTVVRRLTSMPSNRSKASRLYSLSGSRWP